MYRKIQKCITGIQEIEELRLGVENSCRKKLTKISLNRSCLKLNVRKTLVEKNLLIEFNPCYFLLLVFW